LTYIPIDPEGADNHCLHSHSDASERDHHILSTIQFNPKVFTMEEAKIISELQSLIGRLVAIKTMDKDQMFDSASEASQASTGEILEQVPPSSTPLSCVYRN